VEINIQNLPVLIDIPKISVDISKTYQVDRIWSFIHVDKYPKSIRVDISKTYQVDRIRNSINVDKYPRHISVDNIQDISALINIQNLFVLIISKTSQVYRLEFYQR
jgi:hypothetical protein